MKHHKPRVNPARVFHLEGLLVGSGRHGPAPTTRSLRSGVVWAPRIGRTAVDLPRGGRYTTKMRRFNCALPSGSPTFNIYFFAPCAAGGGRLPTPTLRRVARATTSGAPRFLHLPEGAP